MEQFLDSFYKIATKNGMLSDRGFDDAIEFVMSGTTTSDNPGVICATWVADAT